MFLLREGAESDKRDVDGKLAIDLAPDTKVVYYSSSSSDCSSPSKAANLHRFGSTSCRVQSGKASM